MCCLDLPLPFPLTISIDVVITFVPQPVLVRIFLSWVVYSYAVVTCIAVEILVTVSLVHIWHQPAIILQDRWINACDRESADFLCRK